MPKQDVLDLWTEVKRELQALTAAFDSSLEGKSGRQLFDEFLSHNELGLAFETLCDFLIKSNSSQVTSSSEAHHLAQAIVGIGEKLTGGVMESPGDCSERPQRVWEKAPIDELRTIAERAAAHLEAPYSNHAELLYDDRGLPK